MMPLTNVALLVFFGLGQEVYGCKLYNKGPLTNNTICGAHNCGVGAHCNRGRERPECACLPDYSGDPLSECLRNDCVGDSECLSHQVCENQHCVDGCEGSCGNNTRCEVQNHVVACSCLDRYSGDPLESCEKDAPAAGDACHHSPCGPNSICRLLNGCAVCQCLPGYRDAPPNCRFECESDSDCEPRLSCRNFKCMSPCKDCGMNADCEVVAPHSAICKCPRGYSGDPYEMCSAECSSGRDCPSSKPACIANQCINPCIETCGVNANCYLTSIRSIPICSCPTNMTGDPFIFCRPIEARDVCVPNPCGDNARCESVSGHAGAELPICFCPAGYIGDPIVACAKGECELNTHCSDHLACAGYQCVDPCLNTQCGSGAVCTARLHRDVCTCRKGYTGDALVKCYRQVRLFRYRRNAVFTEIETKTASA